MGDPCTLSLCLQCCFFSVFVCGGGCPWSPVAFLLRSVQSGIAQSERCLTARTEHKHEPWQIESQGGTGEVVKKKMKKKTLFLLFLRERCNACSHKVHAGRPRSTCLWSACLIVIACVGMCLCSCVCLWRFSVCFDLSHFNMNTLLYRPPCTSKPCPGLQRPTLHLSLLAGQELSVSTAGHNRDTHTLMLIAAV